MAFRFGTKNFNETTTKIILPWWWPCQWPKPRLEVYTLTKRLSLANMKKLLLVQRIGIEVDFKTSRGCYLSSLGLIKTSEIEDRSRQSLDGVDFTTNLKSWKNTQWITIFQIAKNWIFYLQSLSLRRLYLASK